MPLSSLALFKSGSVVLSARQRTELPSLPVGEATLQARDSELFQMLVRRSMPYGRDKCSVDGRIDEPSYCLGRSTQNTVCDLRTRYRLCCNPDSDAESGG